jgi:hypothetical protein
MGCLQTFVMLRFIRRPIASSSCKTVFDFCFLKFLSTLFFCSLGAFQAFKGF